MKTESTAVVKEALIRELERHIETVCKNIAQDIVKIDELTCVTQDNFEYMSIAGESLENLQSSCAYIKEYLLTVKTAEKLFDKLIPISFKQE